MYESDDEYDMLDLMDSLVRKSLVTVDQAGGRTRYGMLETIRQFAEDQLVMTGTIIEVRDRHAQFFADQTTSYWQIWDGPRQRESLDWVAAELANLRASFRWATDQGDLGVATVIAAHTAIMSWPLQRFEPVGWAEEILEAAVEADLPQLPRLYIAASLCLYGGRPDVGVEYARSGREVGARSRATTRSSTVGADCCRRLPISSVVGSIVGWRSAPIWRRDRVSLAWSGSAA